MPFIYGVSPGHRSGVTRLGDDGLGDDVTRDPAPLAMCLMPTFEPRGHGRLDAPVERAALVGSGAAPRRPAPHAAP